MSWAGREHVNKCLPSGNDAAGQLGAAVQSNGASDLERSFLVAFGQLVDREVGRKVQKSVQKS